MVFLVVLVIAVAIVVLVMRAAAAPGRPGGGLRAPRPPVSGLASGAGAVRHMYFHPSTREIWFGTDANTIGRAKVP